MSVDISYKQFPSPKGGPVTVNNLNIQCYIDARLVASLARWMEESNLIPCKGSYSRMIRLLLDAIAEDNDVPRFRDTEKALAYLASKGFSVAQLGSPPRARKIRAQLSAESLEGEAQVPLLDLEAEADVERVAEIEDLFDKEEPDA